MLFFTITAIAIATLDASVTTTEDKHSPTTVASVLTSINVGCLRKSCMNSIEECDEGSTCHKKLQCIKGEPDLSDAVSCFNDVKWPHLDNGLVQILDCGQHEKCMPMTDLGMSLLEEELHTRDIPSMKEKASLIQIREAIESKLHGHMVQAANSMMMMKAHLQYMEAAGQAVKETTSLIQEVAKDETMAPEEKLHALDHLASHLAQIQHDVQSQQTKIASLAQLAEYDDEDEPEETEHMDEKEEADEEHTDAKAEEHTGDKEEEHTDAKTEDHTEAKAEETDTKAEETDAKAEETDAKAEEPADAKTESTPEALAEKGVAQLRQDTPRK